MKAATKEPRRALVGILSDEVATKYEKVWTLNLQRECSQSLYTNPQLRSLRLPYWVTELSSSDLCGQVTEERRV
jgi:hypothetical protein